MIRAPLDLAFFLGVHTHIQRHIKELDGWKKLETNEKGHTTKAKQKGRGSVSRLTKGRQTKGTSAYHARAVQGRAGKKKIFVSKKVEKAKPCEEKRPGFAINFSPKDETHYNNRWGIFRCWSVYNLAQNVHVYNKREWLWTYYLDLFRSLEENADFSLVPGRPGLGHGPSWPIDADAWAHDKALYIYSMVGCPYFW